MATEKRLIDANALKSEFEWLLSVVNLCNKDKIRDTIERIEKAPTVDAVEVVHGRWIMYLDGDSVVPDRFYRCSECCDSGWGRKWPYCPNCGADMRERKDND